MTMTREVQSCLRSSMTVADLVDELMSMPQDAKVVFTCDYGDYHHTQQALPVVHIEAATSSRLKESAYSHSRVELLDEDENEGIYFCEKCNEGTVEPRCEKCGTICVDTDGNPAVDDDEEETEDIVVMRTERC